MSDELETLRAKVERLRAREQVMREALIELVAGIDDAVDTGYKGPFPIRACVPRMAKANTALASDTDSTPSNEVERLRKQQRVMRDFLVYLTQLIEKDGIPEAIESLALVLSDDFNAGSDLLTREQVQPLVDALYAARQVIDTYEPAPMANVEARWKIENALANARTLAQPL